MTRFIAWFGTARGSLVLLWLIWLAPRLLLAFSTVIPSSDAAWYFDRAREMSEGLGYRDHGGPTAYWPPGWPLTMTVLFRIFGVSTLVVALFNLLCNAVSAWVMQDLARRIGHSVLAGRIALLLIALYPNNAFYVPLAMTECFYTALLLGMVAFAFVELRRRLREKARLIDWWMLPYGIAAYVSAIAVVFSGQSRFHYPVMPFAAMVCGWLVVWWADQGSRQKE